ncbi:MAG: response regulator [Magnetococcales bacterium]|nr:response regulator [Magnetococcales bacterium]
MPFAPRTLRSRILPLLIGIGLLPLLVLGGWTWEQTTTIILTSRIAGLAEIRDAKKREIELYFQERLGDLMLLGKDERVMRILASMPEIPNTSGNPAFLWLEQYKATYRYHDIILTAASGKVLFSMIDRGITGGNITQDTLAHSAPGRIFTAAGQKAAVLDALAETRTGPWQGIYLGMPMHIDKSLLGVTILQIQPKIIEELITTTQTLGTRGEIFIAGKADGAVTLRTNRQPGQGQAGDPFLFAGFEDALSGAHGIKRHLDRNGVPVLTAYAPLTIPGLDWILVVQTTMEEIEAPVRQWATLFAAFACALLLVSAWLAWLLARNLAAPVAALAHAAGEIAKGQRSARVDLERVDEIGQLGEAFNRMAEAIENENWLKGTSAEIRDLTNTRTSEEEISQAVITALARAVDAGQGILFLQNDEDGRYHPAGRFACPATPDISLAPGELLVGQCALEKRTIRHRGIPSDYPRIGSGLGETGQTDLILVPILAGGKTASGVLELISFHPFTASHAALLEGIAPALGLTLERARQARRTTALLEEVQRQAMELAVREEELRTQSHELAASEEELRSQNDVLRETSRTLKETNAELEAVSRYKSEFLANMSHELRTPLNSILIIAANWLENGPRNLTDGQLTSARILQESGQELLGLIDGILDLAKIEAGKMDFSPQPVDPAELLEEARRGFLPVAGKKGLEFVVERDPALPASVRLDRPRVLQILRNLLSNAFKFTEQGQVTLRLGQDDKLPEGCLHAPATAHAPGYLLFSVSDTGIGIAPEQRSLIFDAFRQIDSGSDRKHGGTGLGLSISKSLAELMRGTLCLTSIQGSGSRFTLALPLEVVAMRTGEQRRVLVLDGDAGFRARLIAQTRDLPVELEFVEHLEQARQRLNQNPRDCVILDPERLDEDAEETLRQLRPKSAQLILRACAPLDRERWSHLDPFVDRIVMREEPEEQRMMEEILLLLRHPESEAPAPPPPIPRLTDSGRLANRRVLLVDDDMRNTFALTQTLEARGMRVAMAPDGTTALRLLDGHPETEIVLMDVMMPGMDGLETIRRIRAKERFARLPILVLTAKAMPGDRENAITAGANDYLAKPVRTEQLFAMLDRWLPPREEES